MDFGELVLLRLPIEQFYEDGNSKARNPKIQNMLRMIGFGENVGSGFPKIIAAWKETNWGEPQLMNKLDVDEVELVLPVPSAKSSTTELSNELSIELPEGLSMDNSLDNSVVLDLTDGTGSTSSTSSTSSLFSNCGSPQLVSFHAAIIISRL